MIVQLVSEAQANGARKKEACKCIGVALRTLERWELDPSGCDGRQGPKTTPANALSEAERKTVLEIANSPEFRRQSPKQIVPVLAENGRYVASEATFYRILRANGQMAHRLKSRPAKPRPVPHHIATGPNQVWAWDITYIRSTIRGIFFYLYLILDVWSRKIVGFSVETEESDEHAARLFRDTCATMKLNPKNLVLHSDNGRPMKGSAMIATLERLGVMTSFSRPGVSNDNAYAEALFRTMKYRPNYPSQPFGSVENVMAWVTAFVRWYNTEHRHSALGYVTPEQRHSRLDIAILENRQAVYAKAKRRHPERWSRQIRPWTRPENVELNPGRKPEAPDGARCTQRAETGAIAPPPAQDGNSEIMRRETYEEGCSA